MPRISISELEELTNDEDIDSPIIARRKLRKEKKESRSKTHMTPNEDD
jgi:hypothetical protein